jgi:hypothetical protein
VLRIPARYEPPAAPYQALLPVTPRAHPPLGQFAHPEADACQGVRARQTRLHQHPELMGWAATHLFLGQARACVLVWDGWMDGWMDRACFAYVGLAYPVKCRLPYQPTMQ